MTPSRNVLRATRTLPLVAVVTAAAAASTACDSTTPSRDEHYVLVTVNEQALPADHPQVAVLEITAGGLTLHDDGTATEYVDVRCRIDLPAGTTCEVTQARQTRSGTWSMEEGWIRLSEQTFQAERSGGRVTVEYGLPPSMGFFPRATFVYER